MPIIQAGCHLLTNVKSTCNSKAKGLDYIVSDNRDIYSNAIYIYWEKPVEENSNNILLGFEVLINNVAVALTQILHNLNGFSLLQGDYEIKSTDTVTVSYTTNQGSRIIMNNGVPVGSFVKEPVINNMPGGCVYNLTGSDTIKIPVLIMDEHNDQIDFLFKRTVVSDTGSQMIIDGTGDNPERVYLAMDTTANVYNCPATHLVKVDGVIIDPGVTPIPADLESHKVSIRAYSTDGIIHIENLGSDYNGSNGLLGNIHWFRFTRAGDNLRFYDINDNAQTIVEKIAGEDGTIDGYNAGSWDCSGAGVEILDMDQDGNPDTLIATVGDVTVSHDVNSYNIDIDGDLIADIVILK
jgi:hypothetical protein